MTLKALGVDRCEGLGTTGWGMLGGPISNGISGCGNAGVEPRVGVMYNEMVTQRGYSLERSIPADMRRGPAL